MKTIAIYIRYLSFWLLFLTLGTLIIYGCYFYITLKISVGSLKLLNMLTNSDMSIPMWLYLAEYLLLVFTCICFILLLYIAYYKKHKNVRRSIRGKYIDCFVKGIFSYLYSSGSIWYAENEKKNLCKLWSKLNNDYAKRLFINIIRQVYLETTGPLHEKSLSLFKSLKYDSFIRTYSVSPFIRNNLFAIKIIRDFNLKGYERYILRFAKRKNDILRSAALVSLVQFDPYDNLFFLVDQKIKITVWDINLIIIALQTVSSDKIEYRMLVNSNNPEISTLGIMLASRNKRVDLKLEIKSKMSSSNELLRETAFLAFAEFADTKSDFDVLMFKFETASEKAQIDIIKKIVKYPEKAVVVY